MGSKPSFSLERLLQNSWVLMIFLTRAAHTTSVNVFGVQTFETMNQFISKAKRLSFCRYFTSLRDQMNFQKRFACSGPLSLQPQTFPSVHNYAHHYCRKEFLKDCKNSHFKLTSKAFKKTIKHKSIFEYCCMSVGKNILRWQLTKSENCEFSVWLLLSWMSNSIDKICPVTQKG